MSRCCKPKMYVPNKEEPAHLLEPSKINNIMLIYYSALLDNKTHHNYSPMCCRACSAALSKYSVLYSRENYLDKMTEDGDVKEKNDEERAKEEEKNEEPEFLKGKYIEDLREDESAWVCEYCGVHNRVPKDTKIPSSEDELYLLKRSTTIQDTLEEEKTVENPDINIADDTNLVFCIDVSGSMAETHTVTKNGQTARISRLKLIVEAVLKQIEQMKITHPNRKLGLVTFDTNVFLFGDCTQAKSQVTGSFTDFERMLELSKTKASELLTKSIKNSHDELVFAIKRLAPNSSTALGPALLCSLGLVQGKPGSRIIVCTDGLANIGLGSLGNGDISEETKAFYDRVGDIATESGVSISIITVEGNACRVDALGPTTDKTGGTILRVDPADMDLSEMAANNLIATNVKLRAILHEGLSIENEDARTLQRDRSILVKNVGSVSANNEMYFEYRVKRADALKKLGTDIENMTFLPLQAQISYTDLKGNEFIRIFSKQQELTKDQDEADKEVDAPILTGFVGKATANLALNGNVSDAKKKNTEWAGYINHVKDKGNIKEKDKEVIEKFEKENVELNLLVQESEQKNAMGIAKRDDVVSKLYKHVQMKK